MEFDSLSPPEASEIEKVSCLSKTWSDIAAGSLEWWVGFKRGKLGG